MFSRARRRVQAVGDSFRDTRSVRFPRPLCCPLTKGAAGQQTGWTAHCRGSLGLRRGRSSPEGLSYREPLEGLLISCARRFQIPHTWKDAPEAAAVLRSRCGERGEGGSEVLSVAIQWPLELHCQVRTSEGLRSGLPVIPSKSRDSMTVVCRSG